MANKKSCKKKAAEVSESKAAPVAASKAPTKKAVAAKLAPKPAKKASKSKSEKPGFFARTKSYFTSVRSEMKRVVWPSKKDLLNYSVAVCVSLIVVGVVIALLDAVIGQGLVLFAGLRG